MALAQLTKVIESHCESINPNGWDDCSDVHQVGKLLHRGYIIYENDFNIAIFKADSQKIHYIKLPDDMVIFRLFHLPESATTKVL